MKIGDDELCDCIVGDDAIDTKYRIGSGDSGKSKLLKGYGKSLSQKGLRPVLLIVRKDSLSTVIKACRDGGGWEVLEGKRRFEYIYEKSGFDLLAAFDKFAKTKEFYITR